MKLAILLTLFFVFSSASICQQPQKALYISYSGLSKLDTIGRLISSINSNITTFKITYIDKSKGITFSIINLHPQCFYNDHYQVESYLDKFKVRVDLGIMTVSSMFTYQINYSSTTKTGKARARGFMDPSYFIKRLQMTDGHLEWSPQTLPNFSFSQFFNIQYSTPSLNDSQQKILNMMLNSEVGNYEDLKNLIAQQMNRNFILQLRDHLNHEQIINSSDINYTYKNITLKFTNFVKSFELQSNLSKGLKVFSSFGLENSTEQCTVLPKQFDSQQYGGIQQIISFNSLRAATKQAITRGLFDIDLDDSWEVPSFQFRMGDLGKAIPHTQFFPAADRFYVRCRSNQTRMDSEFKFSKYDNTTIYLRVPETCTLKYQDKDFLAVDMLIVLEVKLYAQDHNLRIVVIDSGVIGDSYRSLDPKFVVESQFLAHFCVTSVINILREKAVFGTGFPIMSRHYPILQIVDDRILIYDPSQN